MLALVLLIWGCEPAGTPRPPLATPAAQAGPGQAVLVQGSATPFSGATNAPPPAFALTVPPAHTATFTAEPMVTPPAEDQAGTATITPEPTANPSPATTSTPAPAATAMPSAAPTITAAGVGPTPDGTARTVRVPILMYHYISVPPKGADVYRQDLSVTPERFASHLAYLHDHGYHVVTLDDLLYALTQGKALPEKPVILTFDDGYADNYTNAFPLLQKYGYLGHFFLITDFVNQGRPEYLSWAQIEEMAAAGQRFGSHSRDHPDLRGKPVDYLVWQALGGTEAIQEHLGYHPRWIAYPSGGYDQRVIDVFRSANYWGGLSTEQGATHSTKDLFTLSRVRVRGRYTAQDLGRLLETNW